MTSRTALSQLTLPAAPTASGQASTKAYVDLGMRTVSDLNSISSPATGQLALLTTDLMIYRYTGSAWLGVMHTAPGGGFARYRKITTGQQLNSGAPTKLQFPTGVNTHGDISPNGAFDIFTLNRGGCWTINATAAIPGVATGNGFTLWVANQDDTSRYDLVNDKPNNGWISARHVTSEIVVSAGAQVAIWAYQDTGSQVTTDVAQINTVVSLRWTGP